MDWWTFRNGARADGLGCCQALYSTFNQLAEQSHQAQEATVMHFATCVWLIYFWLRLGSAQEMMSPKSSVFSRRQASKLLDSRTSLLIKSRSLLEALLCQASGF